MSEMGTGANSARKGVVIVKGSGGAGLGDRTLGLVLVCLYAHHAGRAVAVDWRDTAFGGNGENVFPKLYQVMELETQEVPSDATDVAPSIWSGRLDMSIDELRALDLAERNIVWAPPAPPFDPDEVEQRYGIDPAQFDYREQATVLWSSRGAARMLDALKSSGQVSHTVSVEEFLRSGLRTHIRFAEAVEKQVSLFWGARIAGRPALGVHVRFADEARAVRFVPEMKDYTLAVTTALQEMSDDAVIVLCTDHAAVEGEFVRRFGRRRVIARPKWLPEDGGSIHMNPDNPDGVAAAQDSLVDVGLLASCDRRVLTGYSSFSLLGSWFAREDLRDVWVYRSAPPLLRRLGRAFGAWRSRVFS